MSAPPSSVNGEAMTETDPNGLRAACSAFNAASTEFETGLDEVQTEFEQMISACQQIKATQTAMIEDFRQFRATMLKGDDELKNAMKDLHSAFDEAIDALENEEFDETAKI